MDRLKTYAKAIVQSFYHPPLYRAVIFDWRGFGGLYLLILSAVLGLAVTIMMAVLFQGFTKNDMPGLLAQMPKMVFQDNQLKVIDKVEPIIIKVADNQGIVTIDTQSDMDVLRKDKTSLIILGRDGMLFKTPQGMEQRLYKNMKDITLDPVEIKENWPNPVMIGFFIFPVMLMGQLINLVFMAMAIAIGSYAMTAFMAEDYIFETRLRIASIALTPPFLLSKFLAFAVHHDTSKWFDLLLGLLYFYVIVLSTRVDPKTAA